MTESQHVPAHSLIEEIEDQSTKPAADAGSRGWSFTAEAPTTVILVRHGVTPYTIDKRFSGGLASANPGLSDAGREQIRLTTEWLSPLADDISAVVSSPVRRTLDSAEIISAGVGCDIEVEHGFAEMEFGDWDGMTFTEVAEKHPDELKSWLGSLDVPPTGGESFRQVQERVLLGLDRLLETHAGRTVVVVSHVTPIKVLVSHVVGAPLEAVYRMELTPASVTVLSFFAGGPDGTEPMASMRLFNARPGADVLPPSRF